MSVIRKGEDWAVDYIIYPVKLLETRDFGGAARAFYFEKPQGFSWDEAAHMHLALPGFDEGGVRNKALIHHLSIITLPEEGRVGFLTRLDSSDSVYKKTLAGLKTGDSVYLFKPGSILRLRRDGRPVVLLSMGVGAGVLRPLALRYAKNQEGIPSFTACLAARGEGYPFEEELAGLRAPGLAIRACSGRAAFAHALESLPFENSALYLIVGSDSFIKGCIDTLLEKGVSLDDMVIDLKPEKRAALLERLGFISQPA
jgi:hypothetical protein